MDDRTRAIDRIKPKLMVGIAGSIVLIIGVGAFAYTLHLKREPLPRERYQVDFSPVRGDVQPLRLRKIGFEYKCSECHRTFQNEPGRRPLVAQHTGLTLNHGSNDYCLNCHHPKNRDVYVDHDGSEIPADQPARLCAKCHGPTYKDWLVGIHGRLSGTWNPARPQATRLLCIQCHDPHSPKFPALHPMPAPVPGRIAFDGGESSDG